LLHRQRPRSYPQTGQQCESQEEGKPATDRAFPCQCALLLHTLSLLFSKEYTGITPFLSHCDFACTLDPNTRCPAVSCARIRSARGVEAFIGRAWGNFARKGCARK